ncbi:MAG TPA: hypothetical protein PLR20_05490 [Syntrophales bacterium]|nr:hypothetical protein [Syntrophales bacterium]HOX94466.1 hypothetical protein [Syntrophales bacterium]HPI58451.1 hypothetical protein [Syntrophales bacterium]HPN25951.1 hypothetical protein [Syntrophales bacterium]HQM28789.1 hypothetical protein [Syntrophales bacterium]
MIREIVTWPCVGCGYCCVARTCTFGVSRHPEALDRVCPELQWNGRRYICKLMQIEGRTGSFYRMELRCGNGCVSQNPWRRDVRERTPDEIAAVEKKSTLRKGGFRGLSL